MWDDIIRKTIIPTKLKTTCHKTLYICLGIPWQQNLIQKLVFQRWFKNQCSKLRRFSKNRKKHRFRICFFFLKHLWRAVVGCPYPLCKDLGFRVASDLRKKKQYQWCSHTKARHQTWPGARNSLAGTFEVYDLPSTRISCKKTRILKRSSVNSCYPPSQRSVSNFPSLWEAPQGSELIAGIDNS